MARDRTAPAINIRVRRQGATAKERVDMSNRILSISFEDTEAAADKLTISVDNFDLELLDDPIFRKGNIIEASWGYAGDMTPPRECVVQRVKGLKVLSVEALSKSILMHKEKKSRVFENMKRSEAVATIAREHGYGDAVQHIEDTEVVIPVIHQVRQTDAAFVMELAKREHLQFYVDFDGFHFHQRRLDQAPLRSFTYYTDPGAGDVIDIDTDTDVTAKPASVTAKGRDAVTKADINVRADESTLKDTTGLGAVREMVDPKTGESTLQVGTGQDVVNHTTEPNAKVAERVAKNQLAASQLSTVILSIKAIGDPAMVAKSIIQVNGIRSLSGKYYVTTVTHTVQPGEYTMSFKCKRDGRSKLSPAGKASEAKPNTQAVNPDPNALTPREVVDPRTGTTTIEYHDTRGRPGGV